MDCVIAMDVAFVVSSGPIVARNPSVAAMLLTLWVLTWESNSELLLLLYKWSDGVVVPKFEAIFIAKA